MNPEQSILLMAEFKYKLLFYYLLRCLSLATTYGTAVRSDFITKWCNKGPEPSTVVAAIFLNLQFNLFWLTLSIIVAGTKEAAFVYALSSAAVSYTVTRACSTGKLEACSCGREPRLKLKKSNWRWGGCSDNIAYGTRFSKRFTMTIERARMRKYPGKGTDQALMNIHNTDVGIRVSILCCILYHI